MSDFIEIKPEEFQFSPFKIIGHDWMLITASKGSSVNTMTASWGGLGVMWNKNVAYIVIRPQRYTKEFVDSTETFSLCFFDEEYKKQLSYLGTVSGKDEDKISKSKLELVLNDTAPYFKEANKIIFCKKLYAQEYTPECFLAEEVRHKNYPQNDFHTLYIAEVTKILIRE